MFQPGTSNLFRALSHQQVAYFQPFELLSSFEKDPYVALLENPGKVSRYGRYAYLCCDPLWVLQHKSGETYSGPPSDLVAMKTSFFCELQRLLDISKGLDWDREAQFPPFLGGAVGSLGYELLHEIEAVPKGPADDLQVAFSQLVFYGTVFVSDQLTGSSWVFSCGFDKSPVTAKAIAKKRLQEALGFLDQGVSKSSQKWRDGRDQIRAQRPQLGEADLTSLHIRPKMSRKKYMDAIEVIQEQIRLGNAFEVCLTQRMEMDYLGSAEHLYEILRAVSPAPMAAYLRFADFEILSSSPERFLSLDLNGRAESRPIKGTRPRGDSEEQDLALFRDLANSEKDAAENIMIVDLVRNDLGRVCQLGSVTVPELRAIEAYEFTYQMVSIIEGQLMAHQTVTDLIRAGFPGGSMTGAPKVEAMKIINRLEPVVRGSYAGGIGYIGYDGVMDLSIAIRCFTKVDQRLFFSVGGAIVSDSDPSEEYQEILDKAHGLVIAWQLATEAKV